MNTPADSSHRPTHPCPARWHRQAGLCLSALRETVRPAPLLATSLLAWLVVGLGWSAAAATLHVWPESPAPASPYADWATAARTIQEAVDAAQPGDTVLVTNGLYATGGQAVHGLMTNRVAVTKPLTLRSVNGPEVTVIRGYQPSETTNGDGAIRCVYLTNGAVLSGFTLTQGATRDGRGDYLQELCGGGLWCESTDAFATNCILNSNSAHSGGGARSGTLLDCRLTGNRVLGDGAGAHESTLLRCLVSDNHGVWGSGGGAYWSRCDTCAFVGNSADEGGGVAYGTLDHCTLTGNAAYHGGGVIGCDLRHCLVYYNTSRYTPNYEDCSFDYSDTTPLPVAGLGNLSAEPQLASPCRLSAASPCRGAGAPTATAGLDLDGEPWLNPPSIGCDEWWPDTLTGSLTVTLQASRTNVPAGVTVNLTGWVTGQAASCVWDLGDGTVLSNRPFASYAWGAAGDYTVVFRAFNQDHPEGVSASVLIRVAMHYVSAASANPWPPYESWETAAHTIQEAVDAMTEPGALILVTNGLYASGGRTFRGTLTNRLVVDRPVTVKSVNGPEVTVIQGCQVPETTNGESAIRCAYLGAGAVLSGFTLTQGATRALGADLADTAGGGVQCESLGATVTNCLLVGNAAIHGGGVANGTVFNSTLLGNVAERAGGGASSAVLHNCALARNSARGGGAVEGGTLNHCTLIANTAHAGGGTYNSTLHNSVLYYNTADHFPNYASGSLDHCCTSPDPGSGSGNLTADPQLASTFHLSAASPCRAAGDPADGAGLDLDGEAWLNPPSIGCDEYHPDAIAGTLTVAFEVSRTNLTARSRLDLTACITGRLSASVWDFGDGTVLSNRPLASHVWDAPGDYQVVLRAYNETYPEGLSATLTLRVAPQPVHYVAADSTNPVPPYSSWATAAQTLQDAVEVAVPDALVLVTNGLYATGGQAVHGLMTNRVAVTKPVTVQSVNGPEVTVIAGYQVPGTTNGDNAIRCVYLTNGAVLSGFTLSNGATRLDGAWDQELTGGGLWCESTNALATHCTLWGNAARYAGGGAYNGLLRNCTLLANSAERGGGASSATLENCALTGNSAEVGGGTEGGALTHCTLTGNSANFAGGAFYGAFHNCILYYNTADLSPNSYGGTLHYCCTTPDPDAGIGNLTLEPQLASGSHLSPASPCRSAGNPAYSTGLDLDGEPWLTPPSIGCDEAHPDSAAGPLTTAIRASTTYVAPGFPVDFTALISGRLIASVWDFGDGTVLSNRPYASHAWSQAGDFPVVLRAYNGAYPEGLSATVSVQVVIHRVSATSANPLSPYTSWETAAHTIQEAVDAATEPQAVVLVTNGLYATGGRAVEDTLTNRVVVDRPITVRSVNGPEVTTIQGYQLPGSTNGDGAIRCAYLTNGAVLGGFTLAHGATRAAGDPSTQQSGGGVWCLSTNALVTHCRLLGNSAARYGGGACQGTLRNCTLAGNSAAWAGGGAYGPGALVLESCALHGNTATNGGGVCAGTLSHCTLTGNAAESGGGARLAVLDNCIVYYNAAPHGSNYSDCTLNSCCTTPDPGNGNGNFTAEPQLASLSHLSAASPCRGAGNVVTTTGFDFDDEPWLAFPSVGCDEYRPETLTGPLAVAIIVPWTNLAVGFPLELTALIQGRLSANVWDWGDGSVSSNQPYARHAWSTPGLFPVVLRAYNQDYPEGLSATVTVAVAASPVHYVAAASPNPLPPYSSWETAAHNIQEAVDSAVVGGEVVVTNGTYASGGRARFGLLTNRVLVDRPMRVRSVQGPAETVIQGYQVPGTTNGDGAMRCAYLAKGAVLSGFTLTHGATRASGNLDQEQSGGGLWCESANVIVTNCTLTANSARRGGGAFLGLLRQCTLTHNEASGDGGGAYAADLDRCALAGNSARGAGGAVHSGHVDNSSIVGNSAQTGGGAASATLNHCTLTGNSAATEGGGALGCGLNNCLLYYNTANHSNNYSGGNLNYCCTAPLPSAGLGNLASEPRLASAARLSASSPCRGAGAAAFASGLDLDGEAWLNPPTIGCDEYWAGALSGPLTVAASTSRTIASAGSAVDLTGWIEGLTMACAWDFGDGTVVSNRPYASHTWAIPGDFTVVFRAYNETYPEGVAATFTVQVLIHYVSAASTNPVAPYSSWDTAARTIQEAVDATTGAGALVLVTNGLYATGGRPGGGNSGNRVTLDRPVTVRSVNGPEVTVIQGSQVPGTTNGNAAVRCVYLTNGAVLSGFTLTGGATRVSGATLQDLAGGGVRCESTNATLTNCVLTGNAARYGGGAAFGTLDHCLLAGNWAESGGGAYNATLVHCWLRANSADTGLATGGGASHCTLRYCTLTANTAEVGGGAQNATLHHCLLTGNSAGWGGGVAYGTLYHCTLAGNSASVAGGGAYAWASSVTLYNSILFDNSAEVGPNQYRGRLIACCTPWDSDTVSTRAGITNDPFFLDPRQGDFRLSPISPCINAGINAYAAGYDTDLDANPRIVSGTVDLGAYEYQGSGSIISYAWLWQFGLPTDGSVDLSDTDADGLNTWQEWQAGSDPTNAASVLRLLPPSSTVSGISVSWQSVTNRSYFLERSSGLANRPPFLPVATNLPGQSGTTTFTDTNAPTNAPAFYRVGVVGRGTGQ